MQFNTVAVFSRGMVLELDGDTSFYSSSPFSIWLDGEYQGEYSTNVVALFGLKPDHLYLVRIECEGQSISQSVRTKAERVLLNAKRFGAVADGKTDCTMALQAAIAACPAQGTVYLPAGKYLTGPIFLKSNLNLYLEKGAVLLGKTDRSEYPILPGMCGEGKNEYPLGTWEGNPLDCYASLVTAIGAENVAVYGEGELNGNASNSDWWQDPKVRRGAWRPRTLFLSGCSNVTVAGITVGNSPSWTVHPHYCTGLRLLALSVQNPDDSPNTDGIDPESCVDVEIIGTRISVGDDCISLKSGKYYMALHHNQETRNVTVRNCLLERGHGAVVVGSEISAGVKNVVVSRCLMRNTDRGLRVKTRRGRGQMSVMQNVLYENVTMEHVLCPFVINMFYFCDPDGKSEYVSSKKPLPVDEMTPCIGSLTIRNVHCTDAHQAAVFFYGLPEQPIELVDMENVSVRFAADAQPGLPAMMTDIEPMCRKGIFAANLKKLRLKNVQVEGCDGSMFETTNLGELIKE